MIQYVKYWSPQGGFLQALYYLWWGPLVSQ